jgi:hypothetical protein
VEEGVILRRGSLVLAPSEEKSTVVSKTPSVSIYTNKHIRFLASAKSGNYDVS